MTEAPTPIHPAAQRLTLDKIQSLTPKTGQRLALGCATGLRAWRAAETLQPNWSGDIALLAASIT